MGGVRGGGNCSIGLISGVSCCDVFCDTYALRYVSRSYSSCSFIVCFSFGLYKHRVVTVVVSFELDMPYS